MKRALFAALLLTIAGCQTATLPDPNDPTANDVVQPEVLRNMLKGANDSLQQRWAKGEFDEATYQRLMKKAANDILRKVHVEAVEPDQAWEFAEVYITAQRWAEAETFLRIAVEAAQTGDRRVNDSLRLARALAAQGKVAEAIPIARSVFDAKPEDKAPILVSISLELVPAARGKGHDVELAKLLEEAIDQAKATVVDSNSDAGKDFLAARRFHIQNAWRMILALYRDAKRPDLMNEAEARAKAEMASRTSA